MAIVTLTGLPLPEETPQGVVYGVMSELDDPENPSAVPTTVWDAVSSGFVPYVSESYTANAFPLTHVGGGTWTADLEEVLPGYDSVPDGIYVIQVFARQGAMPDVIADADYRLWVGTVSVSALPPAPASDGRLVSLGWGLPAVVGPAVRLAAGEDVRLTFAPAAGTDPADLGSAVQFVVRHPLTGAVVLTAAGGSLDPDAGTIAVDLASAVTAVLATGLGYPWDLRRTDSGAQAQLARGRLLVMPPTP